LQNTKTKYLVQNNIVNGTTNLKKSLNITKNQTSGTKKINVKNDNENDGNKKHIKTNVGWRINN
jgi:hypothetical protein